MPRRDNGTNSTPHPDGRREGILNDSEGTQIGMSIDVSQNEKFTSLNQIQDEHLKRFEKMMRGNPIDDEK